ncbi:hypothetical protein TSUD_96640 [Trifolium subterraneum]|nr:hypothetical protein TSUD_96640 [Trifolium subterraneum]
MHKFKLSGVAPSDWFPCASCACSYAPRAIYRNFSKIILLCASCVISCALGSTGKNFKSSHRDYAPQAPFMRSWQEPELFSLQFCVSSAKPALHGQYAGINHLFFILVMQVMTESHHPCAVCGAKKNSYLSYSIVLA